jgi:hypothetical protein
MRGAALVAFCTMAAQASAQTTCPTRDDLAGGIDLSWDLSSRRSK